MSVGLDLVILGGGPGGYVAAIRAAQLGLKVALVEKKHLGGVCLNWGCIPTKSLLKSAEMYHSACHLKDFGVHAKDVSFDLSHMVNRSRQISDTLAKGVRHLLKKNGVRVIEGEGRLDGREGGNHRVLVQGKSSETLLTPHVILATGARSRVLPQLKPDGQRIWTAREAMTPVVLPKSLLVIGSGAIGLEFASFYQMLGTNVHVVEMQPQILPTSDPDIAGALQARFQDRGMAIHTKSTLKNWAPEKEGVCAVLQTGKKTLEIEADHILVAAGIVGNTDNLGLEKTAVQIERGHILTHGTSLTDEPGLYAIGDVVVGPGLAHRASHEGVLCVESIAGLTPTPLCLEKIPSCVYSFPQVASIGLTEPQARAKGVPLSIGQFPFLANGKALALGEGDGFVKVIFHKETGELLGAHLVGPEVTELISGFAIAKTLEGTEEDLVNTIFPHPTLSEGLHEAVLKAMGRGLHY